MSIRITCIKKDAGNHENPHIAISILGWINETDKTSGRTGRIEMHDWIKEGGHAYVKDSNGNVARLTAEVSSKGTKYVRTKPDSTTTDNLLKLPECN